MNKNTKKVLAVLLIAAMLFSIMPVSAFAEVTSRKTGELDWSYDTATNTLTIYGNGAMDNYSAINPVPWYEYRSQMTDIVISKGVTTIGDYAFYECTSLNSITIPNTVTSIGEEAFYGCTGLTSITIPDSVTNIGNDAFNICTGLTSIIIPDSVTSIGNHAFNSCKSLKSITISANVTSISNSTFYGCTSLASITIPDSVTSIGNHAFRHCTNLTNITIPDKVTSIGDYAFYECTSLNSITIPANITSIGTLVFYECTSLTSINVDKGSTAYKGADGVLYTADGKTLICYPAGKTAPTFTVPDSVTSISGGAFGECKSLANIEIPNSVTSIGNDAFYKCTSLTSINIPDSVTSIGEEAFYGCTGLTSVTIPASVTSIGKDAFENCTGLTTVNVPCSWNDALYTFGKTVQINRKHKDADNDHDCDYGCDVICGEHKAADGKHTCDYCGTAVTQCADTDSDYKCDICGKDFGTKPSSSSGGGFSGSYNHPVKADNVNGADVTFSDNYATSGETVTITVKPEAGKQIDEVIVTDADGDVIPVTKAGDNQYTFTMPAGKVNVAVTTKAAAYSQCIVMQIGNTNIAANDKTKANDVAPVIVGDRTLVPIRVVTELLGGSADWDDATRTVTLKIDGKTMNMTIGKPIPGFGTSAVIMNDRTYVPVRYVMEMLGAEVTWIAETQQIIIEK